MKRLILLFFFIYSIAFAGNFKITSPAFKYGDFIPVKYTCDGKDLSPPLQWENTPKGTKSFVLIVEDPDAPMGTFTHWIVYDIPALSTGIAEDFPKKIEVKGIKQGINDFGRVGYGGPCPPPGKPHRYFFKLFAIDIPSLNLKGGATKSEVIKSLNGHIIGTTQIMGLYRR
ncbi:MAG: YbhB/YbcL family Raf kinase inhibitor-like protein [Aquificota bacterium]|nr:MAG: YbhB/YbcL family Raf kinase inhibitor-like protein [Aquificota bacterium]